MKKKLLVSVIASTLGLTACGGGGGGGSSSNANTVSVAGKVADGYLVGATVCLDINENKVCDTNEPTATTGAGGAYTLDLTGVSDTDHPIVVEVPATAVDEDTGAPVGAAYVLTAPAGKPEFVSPLTTMVQAQLESNPALSADDAENLVKSNLGYTADSTVDLFTDYVEAKDDGTNTDADEYDRLHKVAQVTAQILGDNFEDIKAAAEAANYEVEEVLDSLLRIIVAEVVDQLDTIAGEVDSTDDLDFDPEIIAGTTVGTIATDDIADAVEAEEVASEVAAVSMESILGTGINWLDSDYDAGDVIPVYGRISYNAADASLTEIEYEYTSTGFQEIVDDNDQEIALGPNGWTAYSDAASNYTVTFNADESASLEHSSGISSERVTGSSVDLAGKKIDYFIDEEWERFIPGGAVFSEGAVGYRWSFTQLTDLYEIDQWTDCTEVASLGNNCNIANLDQTGQAIDAATQLSDLVSPQAWIDDGLSNPNAQFIGFDGDTSLTVEFVDGGSATQGVANYYVYDYANPNPSTGWHSITNVASGTWSIQTVNGEELLTFEVPSSVSSMTWEDDTSSLFYAVHDGFVRAGYLYHAGAVDFDDDFTTNDVGMQDLLNCYAGGTGNCTLKVQLNDGVTESTSSFTMLPFTLSEVENSTITLTAEVAGITVVDIINFGAFDPATGRGTGTLAPASAPNEIDEISWWIGKGGKLKYMNLVDGVNPNVVTKTTSFETDGRVFVKVGEIDELGFKIFATVAVQ